MCKEYIYIYVGSKRTLSKEVYTSRNWNKLFRLV